MQSTQELPCARRYHVEYIASIRIAFSLDLEKARLGDVLPDHDVLELWNLRNSAYEKLGSKCREMPKKFNRFGSEEPDAEWDGTSD